MFKSLPVHDWQRITVANEQTLPRRYHHALVRRSSITERGESGSLTSQPIRFELFGSELIRNCRRRCWSIVNQRRVAWLRNSNDNQAICQNQFGETFIVRRQFTIRRTNTHTHTYWDVDAPARRRRSIAAQSPSDSHSCRFPNQMVQMMRKRKTETRTPHGLVPDDELVLAQRIERSCWEAVQRTPSPNNRHQNDTYSKKQTQGTRTTHKQKFSRSLLRVTNQC